jgi:hypothetical protein
MRILLDECVPRGLKRGFGAGHLVLTVPEAGWAGIKNGTLLALAAEKFDAFITTDSNLEYQQSLRHATLVIVVPISVSNDINALQPLVPKSIEELAVSRPGQIIRVGA